MSTVSNPYTFTPGGGGYGFESPTIASAAPVPMAGYWYGVSDTTIPWPSAITTGYKNSFKLYFDKAKLTDIYNEDTSGCRYVTFFSDTNYTTVTGKIYFDTSRIIACTDPYPGVTIIQRLEYKWPVVTVYNLSGKLFSNDFNNYTSTYYDGYATSKSSPGSTAAKHWYLGFSSSRVSKWTSSGEDGSAGRYPYVINLASNYVKKES